MTTESLNLDEVLIKLGVPQDVIEQIKMLTDNPRDIQAHMRLLIWQEDFIRLFQYLIVGAYGRAQPEWAFDASLGFVNVVSAIAQTNPILGAQLPLEKIQEVNKLHHDIRFLSKLIHDYKTGNIVGYGEEISAYKSFLAENDYSHKYGTSNMQTILNKLSQEYEKQILALLPKIYVALYPLASQRATQKQSEFMSPSGGGPQSVNITEFASVLLTGQKTKREE